MSKILEKNILSEYECNRITRFKVRAPQIAEKARAGQFVVVMADSRGERIPLTIVDAKKEEGSIFLIVQEVGFTTSLLNRLKEGDSFHALIGPLGKASVIKKYGEAIIIGGGVGIAEIYPVAQALKKKRNTLTVVLGARTKKLLILAEELQKISDEFYTATDDGSCGEKGFTTDILKKLIAGKHYDLVYVVGPIPMMKKAAELTRKKDVKTIASLNSLMVDATGMCGCCRITVGGEVKFTCIDGPDFDAHLINWQEAESRSSTYIEGENHICRLGLGENR
ncbi:MAG: sulfide/dihydroorotate dehydrogenase-like FAD/NAD-binding protein [Candidatus Omnitrophica bacterium]|nr:sulfide/dihydroorotate dehydrogenase-like FAD/NAD-binding protein [Candidatus Omnitrophota bacterium]MBD3268767.1 sulfide/dihydroorotate dehydrogenase-like FAD/NAD-binding protein [Candidatus Omnitrophota bacterium]